MKHIDINTKKQIILCCQNILNTLIENYDREIKDTQHQANQFKGAMESRYDTFKEELQDRKNTLWKQYYNVVEKANSLKQIQLAINHKVSFGSIVVLEDKIGCRYNYFIFASIDTKGICVNNDKFIPISLESPLGSILKDKLCNESIEFRFKKYIIRKIL